MEASARRRFLSEYAIIRHAEGRGSGDAAYYDALPYRDLSGRNSRQWAIRARSYRYFERRILAPIERAAGRRLRILDLGAGNGWMSYRLSLRGNEVVALDIFADRLDGLGAIHKYCTPLSGVVAEFDNLPFHEAAFDLAIFNSSIHYSPDYSRTLTEVRRCLLPTGLVIVIDSPVYRLPEHGERMREERHAHFKQTYGFRSDAMRSIEYLDEKTLAELSEKLGIEWGRRRPWYGWNWALRPLRARLTGSRPPSQFFILTGKFVTR